MNSRHGSLLRQRLEEQKNKLIESLGMGVAADFSSYRHTVGHIRGLQDALNISEEIDAEDK